MFIIREHKLVDFTGDVRLDCDPTAVHTIPGAMIRRYVSPEHKETFKRNIQTFVSALNGVFFLIIIIIIIVFFFFFFSYCGVKII
jgi:hypothetical protein